jgi:hypothetical protein
VTRTLACCTLSQDLLLALVPNGVRGPAPAPGRKEAQDHRPPGPAQTLAQAQPRCPARRRDLTLALVPVLTPARAPGPALAPDPGRLPPRPAQRPAQAALGSVRVLAWAKGSEAGLGLAPGRTSGWEIRVRSRRWKLRLEEAAALGSVQV